jgi:hypothetical protein
MQPHTAGKIWQCAQQGIKCTQMEGVGEALDHGLHEILLRQLILAGYYLLEQARQHAACVQLKGQALQLAQVGQVAADKVL